MLLGMMMWRRRGDEGKAEEAEALEQPQRSDGGYVEGEGDHVQCLHPGAACIGGAEQVMQSWEIVFSGLPPGAGLEIDVEQTRVHAADGWGFATCVEKVRSDDGVGTLAATNVFEKQAGEWKIVHHHAHGIQGIR